MSSPAPPILNQAWELIDSANSIVVLMHVNPDGDAIGSAMGLTLALMGLGKNVKLISPQDMPDIYHFLNPEDRIDKAFPEEAVDLAIIVDCDKPDRTGPVEPIVNAAKNTLIIDHHPPSCEFGTHRVTQSDCAATAEIIFYLLDHRKIPITAEMAEVLMTALITDTGVFRFRNTTPETFRIAAALTEAGASTAEISEKVYESRSFAGLRLLGRALNSLRLSTSGKAVWAKLSARDFAETGAKAEDTEGFVNVVHGLKGADVAAMLREEVPGVVRVSFRSRGEAAVNGAAEALGGGGHALAAACVLEGTLDDAEQRVIDELAKWMEF